MPLIIRPSTSGDKDWIISSHGKEYFRDYGFSRDFEIDIANKFSNLRKYGVDYCLWVASYDGNRAGSIAVSKQNEGTGFVNFLLVLKKFRKRGFSKELIKTVIEHSRKQRYELLRLETYSCLVDARELYKKIGFYLTESNKDMKKYGQVFDQEFWELKL